MADVLDFNEKGCEPLWDTGWVEQWKDRSIVKWATWGQLAEYRGYLAPSGFRSL